MMALAIATPGTIAGVQRLSDTLFVVPCPYGPDDDCGIPVTVGIDWGCPPFCRCQTDEEHTEPYVWLAEGCAAHVDGRPSVSGWAELLWAVTDFEQGRAGQ